MRVWVEAGEYTELLEAQQKQQAQNSQQGIDTIPVRDWIYFLLSSSKAQNS